MNLKLVLVFSILATTGALAQAPKSGPPPGPKPTKADVQKVVQLITSDKVKMQTYCDLSKLSEEISAADEKKDQKTVDTLGKQAEAMATKLGPEYASLMDGLQQINPDSPEGKEFGTLLDGLDSQCAKK